MIVSKFHGNRLTIDREIDEKHAILVNLTASRSIVQMLDHLTCSKLITFNVTLGIAAYIIFFDENVRVVAALPESSSCKISSKSVEN